MSSIEVNAHYETVAAKPAAAKTAILTCPSAGGLWYVIVNATVCATGGAATVDVIVTLSAVEYTTVKAGVVPAAGNYIVPNIEGTVLRAGEILSMTPSDANQHIVVNYMVGRPDNHDLAPAHRR